MAMIIKCRNFLIVSFWPFMIDRSLRIPSFTSVQPLNWFDLPGPDSAYTEFPSRKTDLYEQGKQNSE